MGNGAQRCIYHEFCGKGVALEHDGNFLYTRVQTLGLGEPKLALLFREHHARIRDLLDLDYEVAGALGYMLKRRIILQAGWRYLDVDYEPKSTFVYDAATSGLIIGARFNLK